MTNLTSIHETWVRSLASLSGLIIQCCCELWCRLQMWFGSCTAVAMAWAGSHSSDLIRSRGSSIRHGCSPEKTKKDEEEALANEQLERALSYVMGEKYLYTHTTSLFQNAKIKSISEKISHNHDVSRQLQRTTAKSIMPQDFCLSNSG